MRALALTADLMFGSRLSAAAADAGIELELLARAPAVRERLAGAGAGEQPAVLVVDLTDPGLDGAGVVGALRADGLLTGTRILGVYAHVDSAVREQALQAGFDLVVPRSRMAREGPALLARMCA
jgi:CheY-like chemotaxis protein